jgi:hypothetical protein
LSGYASEKTQTVSFDQAVEEIARTHFDGDVEAAETDLLAPLRDSTILAYQNTDAIGERKWRRKNPWVPTIDSVPGISRENTEFFRRHLQNLYDDTLWKKEKSIKKNYRGKLYKNGVYFTLKIDKNGLDGEVKWDALKQTTREKWDSILTLAIKYAPKYPNNKSSLGSIIEDLSKTKNPDRRLGEYFENWNSPE